IRPDRPWRREGGTCSITSARRGWTPRPAASIPLREIHLQALAASDRMPRGSRLLPDRPAMPCAEGRPIHERRDRGDGRGQDRVRTLRRTTPRGRRLRGVEAAPPPPAGRLRPLRVQAQARRRAGLAGAVEAEDRRGPGRRGRRRRPGPGRGGRGLRDHTPSRATARPSRWARPQPQARLRDGRRGVRGESDRGTRRRRRAEEARCGGRDRERDQIAVLEGPTLIEHYITRVGAHSMVGNIYLGRVQNVLPGMEAAFIDVGRGRNAVLYAGEVNWDEDVEGARRIEQALKPGQSVLVQVTKDPLGGKGDRLAGEDSLPG